MEHDHAPARGVSSKGWHWWVDTGLMERAMIIAPLANAWRTWCMHVVDWDDAARIYTYLLHPALRCKLSLSLSSSPLSSSSCTTP